MSVARLVAIECDGCDKRVPHDNESVMDARHVVRIYGWATRLRGGRDLCPSCRRTPGARAVRVGCVVVSVSGAAVYPAETLTRNRTDPSRGRSSG